MPFGQILRCFRAPTVAVTWVLVLLGCDPFGGAWTPLTAVEVAGADPALGGNLVLTVAGEVSAQITVDGATGTLPLPEVTAEVSGYVCQVRDDGVFVGASWQWLAHFIDTYGGEDGALDAPFDHGTGWAVMESVFSEGIGVVDPPLIRLETFPPVDALDVPVVLTAGDAEDRAVAVVPETWFAESGVLPELLFDEPATIGMTILLASAPPSAHTDEVQRESLVGGDRSAGGAVERVLLYEDGLGDGFTVDDLIVGELCVDGEPARLVWVEPATAAEAAGRVLLLGMGAGWSVAYEDWGFVEPAGAGDPLRGPC